MNENEGEAKSGKGYGRSDMRMEIKAVGKAEEYNCRKSECRKSHMADRSIQMNRKLEKLNEGAN